MDFPRQTKSQSERARKLRREMSESEKRLWNRLRANRIGFKFKREQPLGPFTLDPFSYEAMLNVEVDGDQHDSASDAKRDDALKQLGVMTLRFPSQECYLHSDAVANEIYGACVERTGRDPLAMQHIPDENKD